MIYHRLGDDSQAQQYLQHALVTNPHFHLFYADLALRTLAALQNQPGPVVTQETRHGH
jgi:hypothetical protein